ncbi:[acyl-carrier-protein] S-malonyltransferase [Synechococcus sp. RSCCF101]|uniref:ACP S-malonyltransferase n=1 Tax=Synechococcus sp. RSCCF101 TaxID=2511069 RepID=UPI0012490636|nr:ACP S-malonyltransferase [Synechococcus sp. RSCCF101]QEY32889.1 [acyl-carrier-protein] S-malonyltransferase [Synechococcus sp. RSCCF101]
MAVAWVFPGQGSQHPGMADGVLACRDARERFSRVSELLGRDLLAICSGEAASETSPSDLNDTRNTQPALFTVESLLVDALLEQGRQPALVAGHSLGELVALYAAGVLDLESSLQLVHRRSELMAAAGEGGMCAVMGFERERLEQLVAQQEDVVIANDNSAAQVVLSGSRAGLEALCEALSPRRNVTLPVSGAFHSPRMATPAAALSELLDSLEFRPARFPVISNSDPTPSSDAAVLRERLRQQMCCGVRWRETMQAMEQAGISTVVEVGPGKVLSGLVKRSMEDVTLSQISGHSDLGL